MSWPIIYEIILRQKLILFRKNNLVQLCHRLKKNSLIDDCVSKFKMSFKATSTRIQTFLNPQLFPSGLENISGHTLRDHSVFKSNSPVHTYSDSLLTHWGLTKLSHQALVRPGLTQNSRGRHCFPARLSCFCRPFCAVDNVKSLQMSSHLLA